jgi:transcriptional regulator
MDWQKTIGKLREAGYNQSDIAEKCGTVQSNISLLARGKRTGEFTTWETGKKLEKFYKSVFNEEPPE